MTHSLTILKDKFNFDGHDIPFAKCQQTGRIYLHAPVLAKALGFKDSNEMLPLTGETSPAGGGIVKIPYDTGYGVKDTNFIERRLVNKIMMRSRLPSCEPFCDWLSDVAEKIYETGSYTQTKPSVEEPKAFLPGAALELQGAMSMSATMGYRDSHQLIKACDIAHDINGFDYHKYAKGSPLLISAPDQQERSLNPTQIAQRLEWVPVTKGAIKVNQTLAGMGLQRSVVRQMPGRRPKNTWELEQIAIDQRLGFYTDEKITGGTVKKINWSSDVVELIRKHVAANSIA